MIKKGYLRVLEVFFGPHWQKMFSLSRKSLGSTNSIRHFGEFRFVLKTVRRIMGEPFGEKEWIKVFVKKNQGSINISKSGPTHKISNINTALFFNLINQHN